MTKGDVTEPSPERLREPQAAPPFVFDWTEEAEVEGFGSGNASVVRHSVEVIGALPEGALVLEVQLPDGQCKAAQFPSPVRYEFGKEEGLLANLNADWKVVRTATEANEAEQNEDPEVQTTLTVEQYLSITYGGRTFPVKKSEILKQDKTLQKQLMKALQARATVEARLKLIQNQIKAILNSNIPRQKKNAELVRAHNLLQASTVRYKKWDQRVKHLQSILKGGSVFTDKVLNVLKGKAIHYRVYVQHEGGEEIDLIRTPGFDTTLCDSRLGTEESLTPLSEQADSSTGGISGPLRPREELQGNDPEPQVDSTDETRDGAQQKKTEVDPFDDYGFEEQKKKDAEEDRGNPFDDSPDELDDSPKEG